MIDGNGRINSQKFAGTDECFTMHLEFDLDRKILKVSTDKGVIELNYSRTLPPPFGNELNLSYLHLQSAAETADTAGVYLHRVSMKKM